ncbi:MAG: hypothetical protein MIO90_06820 [Methanomassiliicoccales archaeon]|nr:hypothetical protein [Methanomassiliicoccales archaeon]
MAKVMMMPRTRTLVPNRSIDRTGCTYGFEDGTITFNCQGCGTADDAPSEMCMAKFRQALEAHPDATDILLLGAQDVWLRERNVESIRSLIAAEKAWDEFRSTIRSLPCHHPLPVDRVSRYLEKCREGRMELFCNGEGANCRECLRSQEAALDSLRSDRRRARRNMAADRFRIVEVPGVALK